LGASERIIEIPWVFARVPTWHGARVLDVGTAFAPFFYRQWLASLARQVELHVVDLAPAWIRRATVHRADVRRLPFASETFDAVTCISTLEHIGLDNRRYGVGDEPSASRPDVLALRELRRVTRPGGRVLVTVPAGVAGEHSWYRQYSPASWAATVASASLSTSDIGYFTHDSSRGWLAAAPEEVELHEYGIGAPNAAALICASLVPI
jgi:SAM-dependent methyltransferase